MAWTPADGEELRVYHLLTGEAIVYRVVRTEREDDLDNFRSAYQLGSPPPRRVQKQSAPIWMALSALRTLQAAEARALQFPKLGDHVATLDLQAGQGFAVAETIEPGHLSVWGDPFKLRAAVVDLYPVASER